MQHQHAWASHRDQIFDTALTWSSDYIDSTDSAASRRNRRNTGFIASWLQARNDNHTLSTCIIDALISPDICFFALIRPPTVFIAPFPVITVNNISVNTV